MVAIEWPGAALPSVIVERSRLKDGVASAHLMRRAVRQTFNGLEGGIAERRLPPIHAYKWSRVMPESSSAKPVNSGNSGRLGGPSFHQSQRNAVVIDHSSRAAHRALRCAG